MYEQPGIDAPPVIRNLALAGVGAIIAGVVLDALLAASQPVIAALLLI